MTDNSNKRLRAFIAYLLPLDTAALLHKKVRRYEYFQDDVGIRWTPPQNYHLTLRFLGDSTEQQLDQVRENLRGRLQGFSPFVCMSGGIDYFPNENRPRIMTLKLHSGRRMEDLYHICDEAACASGYSPERRAFRPHVTLARSLVSGPRFVPGRLPGYRLQVGELALVASEQTEGGSRYRIIESFAL